MPTPARDRLVALDLSRGVAVLGILAVNMAGFAGPSAATLTPHFPAPGSAGDEAAFAGVFLFFEGKMRALFTLLFGAGLVLFIERSDARGANGDVLQLRRLGWLMVFGLLHFYLFWWGDILFSYALCGMLALTLRHLPPRALLAGALLFFAAWHLAGTASTLPGVVAEEAVRTGAATADQVRDNAQADRALADRALAEQREYALGFTAQIAAKLRERPFWPLEMTLSSIGETLPLILIGMALQRLGFFAGRWPGGDRRRGALAALGAGALWTLAILAWAWPRHFPPQAMSAALLYWTAPAHLAMALGYAALLVSAAPRIAAATIGGALIGAGRMAFTCYIGATIAMTAVFYGWGLSLAGRFGQFELLGFVLPGWAAMLAGSAAWLAKFRQGPLEWAWRSLIDRELKPLRR